MSDDGMNVEPKGTPFYDNANQREMKYVTEGPYKGWLVYKHPDGQWVTLWKATDEDVLALDNKRRLKRCCEEAVGGGGLPLGFVMRSEFIYKAIWPFVEELAAKINGLREDNKQAAIKEGKFGRAIFNLEAKLEVARISALREAAKAMCMECESPVDFKCSVATLVQGIWMHQYLAHPPRGRSCKAGSIHNLIDAAHRTEEKPDV